MFLRSLSRSVLAASSSATSRAACADPPLFGAFARSISFHPSRPNSAKKNAKRKVKLDLGWEKLTAPLEAAPLSLPNLKALTIVHGKTGAGQTGARKFKALLPPLRWQNPEADIGGRWADDDASLPTVTVELSDGTQQEFDVAGQPTTQIFRTVLEAAGADEDAVATSVSWAEKYMMGRPASAKPHEMRRNVEVEVAAAAEMLAAAAAVDAGGGEEEAPALAPS